MQVVLLVMIDSFSVSALNRLVNEYEHCKVNSKHLSCHYIHQGFLFDFVVQEVVCYNDNEHVCYDNSELSEWE